MKTQPAPRCAHGHRLYLSSDGTYHCRPCRHRRAAAFVPLDPDLIADLRATPGVRLLDGPGSSPAYVVTE